jgi:hypothetical protein
MTDKKEVMYNSLLILFSISLAVSGAEIGLALASNDNVDGHKWCEGPTDLGIFHPTYGYREHPDQKYLENRDPAEELAWHAYNSEGFRDTYNSGDENIVVVGDSFTQGNLADQNSTYPHLLDRWSTNTAFLNYGTGGYGTDQQLLVYRDVSRNQDHKMVIVGYYLGNDMKNNVGDASRRPQFAVMNGTLTQTETPNNETQTETQNNETQTETEGSGLVQGSSAQQFQDFLAANTRMYPFVATKLARSIRLVTGTDRGALPELAEQRELTRHLLSAISTEAKQQDTQVLIVGIPTRGEVNPNNPNTYSPEDAQKYGNFQREMLRNVSSESAHVKYLDIKPRLKSEYDQGKSLYGENDAHLNEYGYRITAQAIHTNLVANDVIQPNADLNLSKDYDVERTRCPN